MLNRLELQGRLTRDVELRHTNNGKAIATFTVAWSEKRGDSEKKLFQKCVAWDKSADFVNKYFRKGQEIVVEGSLESRPWDDKNGTRHESNELNVERIHFCGSKNNGTVSVEEKPAQVQFAELDDDGELPF